MRAFKEIEKELIEISGNTINSPVKYGENDKIPTDEALLDILSADTFESPGFILCFLHMKYILSRLKLLIAKEIAQNEQDEIAMDIGVQNKTAMNTGVQNGSTMETAAQNEGALDIEEQLQSHANIQDGVRQMKQFTKYVGRRQLVDMEQIEYQRHILFDKHSKDDLCRFQDIQLVCHTNYGLRTHFIYKCEKCDILGSVWSELEEDSRMDLGHAAVCAAIQTGK